MTSHSICTFLLRDFTQENYFRETDRLTILIWYEVLLWHSKAPYFRSLFFDFISTISNEMKNFTILFDAFLKVWTFQLLIWLICGFSNCIWSCLLFPRLVFAFLFQKYFVSLWLHSNAVRYWNSFLRIFFMIILVCWLPSFKRMWWVKFQNNGHRIIL